MIGKIGSNYGSVSSSPICVGFLTIPNQCATEPNSFQLVRAFWVQPGASILWDQPISLFIFDELVIPVDLSNTTDSGSTGIVGLLEQGDVTIFLLHRQQVGTHVLIILHLNYSVTQKTLNDYIYLLITLDYVQPRKHHLHLQQQQKRKRWISISRIQLYRNLP